MCVFLSLLNSSRTEIMVCFPLHPAQGLACTKDSFIFVWCSNIKLKKKEACGHAYMHVLGDTDLA